MKSKGFKSLMIWARPYVLLVLTIFLLSVLNPLLYSYVPQFIKYVVDVILRKSEGSTITLPSFLLAFYDRFERPLTAITVVGISLIIYQAFRGLLMFLNGYFKGKLAEGIAYDMRTKLHSHIQDLSVSYHNNADTGDLIQRCTSDIDTIKGFLSAQLPEIIYIFSSVAFGAIQMGLANWQIMLVTFAVVPITLTLSVIYFRYVKKKFEEIEKVEANMTTVLEENVNGVRVVKAFANEDYEIRKFEKASAEYRDESKKLNDIMAMYWGSSDFITMTQYAVTVLTAILLVKGNSNILSAGDFVSFTMYIGMIVWPIRGLGRIIGDFGKSVVAAGRINDIMKEKTEYAVDGDQTPDISGNIEFSHVSFKFEDNDKHLLQDVSFAIKSGETVAVIGKTGSGKSTIANILVRILDYESGSVKIDGVELKDISKRWVRKNIGIILQDPFLYAATVYDNIKIAVRDVDQDKVYQAAKMASVHNDIMSFDKGYDTLVGEKGVTLSGGQKQRVAIARMLLLDRPVMIFDDSLSAVDTITDVSIRRALKAREKKLTTIIITHRITTAKEADKIIVLENGRVAAIGTHEELSRQEGLYKNLWDIQGALEDEFVKLVERGEENE